MLHTFVIGLGRAGAGLHVSVLSRLRDRPRQDCRPADGDRGPGRQQVFAEGPLVVCDPRFSSSAELRDALRRWGVRGWALHRPVLIGSVSEARRLLDPERTVVHLATPPAARLGLVDQLAGQGFRRILVEKPLALDERELAEIERLRRRRRLHLEVVAQWLVSSLTLRLAELVRSGALGELRSLSFLQRKPRFTRSLTNRSHHSAFDVEPPHSVGVALRLAGTARLAGAACRDMVVGDTVLPGLGSARLTLRHDCGVRTEIVSDLTSPVRERRIVLRFDRGVAVGHYPGSQDDDYAQLSVVAHGDAEAPGLRARSVFRDDALGAFLLRAYRRFSASELDGSDFALNVAATRLLCAAKRWPAGADEQGSSPADRPAEPSLLSGRPS